MENSIPRQQFHYNNNLVLRKYGADAFVAVILEGNTSHELRKNKAGYDIVDEVPLSDIGGSVTKTLAMHWEDGVTRTQTVIERLKLSTYRAIIAHPVNKVA